MSLLSKAKEIKVTKKVKRNYTPEELELIIGLAKGEVVPSQVAKVLGINVTAVNSYALGALKLVVSKK